MLYVPPPGTRGRYLALSYCWGKSQAVTLTEARLKQQPVGFPLRTLPRTLRDAIIIASHLGFQYIWVDALCIIQDSFEGRDWKQESAVMNKIYGNATLTIAAAAATSTTEGIFSFGNNQDAPKCALPYQLPDGQLGSVNVEAYETEELTEESLDSRAWALQESLISPRLLRYGTQQMSWKCNHLEENANGPLISRSKQLGPRSAKWTSIVTDYTARTLTYNSDRLAALAGYAKLLGTKRPYDEYLAGLWKSELLEGLLWYRCAKSDPNPRPTSYYAPSWSWASIDSAVRFTYWPMDYQSHAEIVNVSSTLPTRDYVSPLNRPQQSVLSIYGYVKHLDNRAFFQESNGTPVFQSTHKFQSQGRRGSEQASGDVILDVSGPFDALEDGSNPPLICVHITPTCGLVLISTQKQNDTGSDLYERIGLATGPVFEEWFIDSSCGPFKDELVRIV